MQVRWWAWQQLLPTLSWLLIILCTVQATDAGLVLRRSRVDGEIGSLGGKAFRPRRVLTDADFVHATSTHAGRYALARASRSWRQGSVRSMIVVNNREHVLGLNKQGAVHLEHYASWHDTNVSAGAATIPGSTSSSSDVGSSTSSGSNSGSSNSRVSTVAVLWNGGGGRQGNVTTLLVGPGLALAPTLAHAHFGDTYKWLLLGADNTVFFLPNVRKLLARFDSNDPWVISDHVTFQGVRPNLFAPRCLPCGFNASRIPPLGSLMQSFEHALMNVQSVHEAQHSERAKSFKKTKLWQSYQRLQDAVQGIPMDQPSVGARFVPQPACPACTPAAACGSDHGASHCPTGADIAHAHGGAGLILSVGLMRKLGSTHPEMEVCVRGLPRSRGGDSVLMECLSRLYNVSITDPGSTIHWRYNPHYTMFSSEPGALVLHGPMAQVAKGACSQPCRWLINHAATFEVKGRNLLSLNQTAAAMFASVASLHAAQRYDAFVELRRAGSGGDSALPST